MEGGLSHFEKALQLRQEKKYPEARVELELACEEGNVYALHYKKLALNWGGFGYKYDKNTPYNVLFQAGRSLLDSTIQQDDWENCEPSIISMIYNTFLNYDNEYTNVLAILAKNGSGWAKCLLGSSANKIYTDNERLEFLMEAYEEGIGLSYRELGRFYEDSDPYKAANFFVMYESLNLILCAVKHTDDVKALYVYGKYINQIGKTKCIEQYDETLGRATDIYLASNNNARKIILYFIWMCQTNEFLCKDMIYEIVKMVWESRRDPSVWM